VDGNKRTSFVAAAVFLELNGREVVADEAEVVETILALASGRLGEAELGRWLEANSLPNAPRRRR
jgi:death-on-curing protein